MAGPGARIKHAGHQRSCRGRTRQLDARFAGPTEAYTQVNGAFGVKFLRDKLQTTIKVINLLDEDIQSHVFGDIMKRQIIGEVRVTF